MVIYILKHLHAKGIEAYKGFVYNNDLRLCISAERKRSLCLMPCEVAFD